MRQFLYLYVAFGNSTFVPFLRFPKERLLLFLVYAVFISLQLGNYFAIHNLHVDCEFNWRLSYRQIAHEVVTIPLSNDVN